MLGKLVKMVVGSRNDRIVNKKRRIVKRINALEAEYRGLSDAELQDRTQVFRSRLAEGETLEQILQELGHVAEGVHTAREVHKRAAELGVEMPITCEVNRVLSHGQSPRTAVENLLRREQKPESV